MNGLFIVGWRYGDIYVVLLKCLLHAFVSRVNTHEIPDRLEFGPIKAAMTVGGF